MVEEKAKKNQEKIERARIRVFRSNKAIYAQAIDDLSGRTIASADSRKILEAKTPSEKAFVVGETLAKKLSGKQVVKYHFDRGEYRYHGRVKELALGLRQGGVKL